MNNKYRVWDIERKEYIENTGNPYIFPFNGITAMKCAGSSCGSIDGEKDYSEFYIIEYSTGLPDKNGKDLDWWEGDILELDGGASGAHVIEWDNNGACFMCGGDELLVNVRDGYKTEKIGNIHIHPELLEK